MNVGEFVEGIGCSWRMVAGLALLYLWTWLLYWGGPFSLQPMGIEFANSRWAAHVVMCAVSAGLVALLVVRLGAGRRAMDVMRAGALVSGIIGTILALWLVVAPPSDHEVLFFLSYVSGTFTGICEGCLLCFWCSLTSSLGMGQAIACNVVAIILGGLSFLTCSALPSAISLALGVTCPIMGFACSFRGMVPGNPVSLEVPYMEHEGTSKETSGGVSRKWGPVTRPVSLSGDRAFLALLAAAFAFGISSGFVNASFEVVPSGLYKASCLGIVFGTIAAALLAAVCVYYLRMTAWSLVFQTALPLMAISYLIMPYEAYGLFGPAVQALGYQYFFVSFWSLLGSRQVRRDVPVTRAVSVGIFSTELGVAVGLLLWNVLCAGGGTGILAPASGMGLFLLLLVAVVFQRPVPGWTGIRPGATPRIDTARAGADEVLLKIRESYGLSPREAEVCALLGAGRNRQAVAERLCVSLETARSHTANVYRKLGVHSQQELLDVFEMARVMLAEEKRESNPW